MKPDRLIEDLTLVPLPQWWENPWLLLALPLLIGLAAYGLRTWWSRRRPTATVAAAASGPDPREAFLARLAALRARRTEWVAHPFAVEVSDILRGYLEAGYAFPVRFQTSREFLESAAGDARLGPDRRATLGEFLGRCDRIKFARDIAAEHDLVVLIDTAERFIREGSGLSDAGGGRS